jgi:hypothetical protein
MSYIGNTPTNQNFVAGADQFNGTGSQLAFTLSRNVNTVFDMFVTVSNVPQDPFTAYTVAGNTLTFDSAPPSGTNNIDVVYRATNVQTFVPSPGATVGGSFGIQGNLNFFGTGNRITGDFSNATIANRVMFQTSTANGQTSIGVLPNGTGGISSVNLFGTTDPANASLGQLATTTNEVRLQSGITGTGTYLPMTFYTGGSERARIATNGDFSFNSGYGSVATAYGCRAWVNFNGTGTVAIRASGNVSSITDNGAGDYTVNFTTAMPDANISVAGSAKEADSGTTDTLFKIVEVASNPSASSVRVMTGGASSAWDSTVVMVSIFR